MPLLVLLSNKFKTISAYESLVPFELPQKQNYETTTDGDGMIPSSSLTSHFLAAPDG